MTQLEWDMGRVDRSVERIDAQLQRHEISAVQRAVIWFMVAYDAPDKPAEDLEHDKDLRTRTVRTTYQNAADWCLAFAPPAHGLKLDRSAICKAVQEWVDRGVIFRQSGRTRTRLVISVYRLNKWFESLGDPFENALFSALPRVDECFQALPDVETCCRVLPRVDECFQALPDVSPQLNDQGINESHSFSQGNELAQLPELPADLWETQGNVATWSLIRSWWESHRLTDRLGDRSETVGATLVGLIVLAKTKQNPPGYFARSKWKPAPYLLGNGREWLKSTVAKQSRSAATCG